MYFLAVFELLSDSLTAIYVELHQCPSYHSILLTQGPIWEIFAKKFWELAILKNELFLSRPFWIFFCFIPMKISPNLYGRMDGSKFWCFPWFPENSLLCVILRYTVYFPYQCVAGRDHRYYIKGVIHKLRWQDEVGRWYWKCQFMKVILKKIRHLC